MFGLMILILIYFCRSNYTCARQKSNQARPTGLERKAAAPAPSPSTQPPPRAALLKTVFTSPLVTSAALRDTLIALALDSLTLNVPVLLAIEDQPLPPSLTLIFCFFLAGGQFIMQVELLSSESLNSLPSPGIRSLRSIRSLSYFPFIQGRPCNLHTVSLFSLDVSRTLATCPRPTALRLVASLSALTTVSSVLGLGGRCGSREHGAVLSAGSVTAGPGGRRVPFLLWGPGALTVSCPGHRGQGARVQGPPWYAVFWERLTAFLRFSGASEGLGLRICLE